MNEKVMIFGLCGSGKSHFALQLSFILGIPLYHLDRYFFIENWIERNNKEFLQLQQNIVDKERWIIDGNATRSLEMRYSKADTAIYFHFNRYQCLWRIFKRLLLKNPDIQDRAEGCKECIRWRLIRYMWGFNNRIQPIINDLREKYPHVEFYTFHNDKDIKDFIALKH